MRAALLLGAVLGCAGCLSFDTDGKVFACDPASGADCDGGNGTSLGGDNGSTGTTNTTSVNGSGGNSDTGTSTIAGTTTTNGNTSATSATTSANTSGSTGTYDDAQPTDVAIGDVDRDGKMDLVLRFNEYPGGDQESVIEVRFGDGNGGFTSQTFVPVAALNAGAPKGLVVTSLRPGGDTSIVVGSQDGVVWRIPFWTDGGNDTPQATANTHTWDPGLGLTTLRAADLDGDGNTDLVLATVDSSGYVVTLMGHGDGTFTASTPVEAGGEASGFVVGDFNGDHHVDVAYVWGYGGGIGWGAGDGGFFSWSTFDFDGSGGNGELGQYATMAVADLNHDGIDDVLFSPEPTLTIESPYIYFGTSASAPPSKLEFMQPAWPLLNTLHGDTSDLVSLAMADLNGDNVPDMVAVVQNTYSGSYNLWTYLLEPDAGLLSASMPDADDLRAPMLMAVGNLNANVVPDVAMVNGILAQPVIVLDP